MTKDKILKLHTLSEEEQKDWLINNGILREKLCACGCMYYESLADCASRLKDEFLHRGNECLMFDLSDKIYGIKELNCKDSMKWWVFQAESIHWIQAALLAKLKTR